MNDTEEPGIVRLTNELRTALRAYELSKSCKPGHIICCAERLIRRHDMLANERAERLGDYLND